MGATLLHAGKMYVRPKNVNGNHFPLHEIEQNFNFPFHLHDSESANVFVCEEVD